LIGSHDDDSADVRVDAVILIRVSMSGIVMLVVDVGLVEI
jgi:hypothetical protein